MMWSRNGAYDKNGKMGVCSAPGHLSRETWATDILSNIIVFTRYSFDAFYHLDALQVPL